MPSTITDFNPAARTLRYRIYCDLNGSGYVEYTNKLIHASLFKTQELPTHGIFEQKCEALLKISNPSQSWANAGIKVKVVVGATGDNGSTYYDVTQFEGITTAQNTVPDYEVKLTAYSINQLYLSKKMSSIQIYSSTDSNEIIRQILLNVGVPSGQISLSNSGYTIPYYIVDSNKPVSEHITDLATVTLSYYGFDETGTFIQKDIFQIGQTNQYTYNTSNIYKYKQRTIVSPQYYNKFKFTGETTTYINETVVPYQGVIPLARFNSLSGYQINAGDTKTFEFEMPNVRAKNVTPLYDGGWLAGDDFIANSAKFYTAYDGSGTQAYAELVTCFVSYEGMDEGCKMVIRYRNTSAYTIYLKTINVYGEGIKFVKNITQTNDYTLNEDVYTWELNSRAIQSSTLLDTVISKASRFLLVKGAVKEAEARAYSGSTPGTFISYATRNGTAKDHVIIEVDQDISENGFRQTMLVRELPPPPSYLEWDDVSAPITQWDIDEWS